MQKHRLFFYIMTAMLTAPLLGSCMSDDDDDIEPRLVIDPVEVRLSISDDGVPELLHPTSLSREDFNNSVVGRGWYQGAVYKIKPDGKVDSSDYFDNMIGIGPSHYYFDTDSLTEFGYHDSHGYLNGGLGYVRHAYTYSEIDHGIYVNGRRVLQINPLGEKPYRYLMAIVWVGMYSDGSNIYVLGNFNRLTNKELKALRRKYSVNFTADEDR